MIIEQIIFWTGVITIELSLVFIIVFLLWHIGMWVEQHNKWYFFALWVVLYSYFKNKGHKTSEYQYHQGKRYAVVELK